MTPPTPRPDRTPSPPGRPPHPDGTARLATRVPGELGTRLGLVRPRDPRRQAPRPALVAVAHGSRDPRALATATALLDAVRAHRPGLDVRLGHIELNEPLLTDTLDALGRETTPPAGQDTTGGTDTADSTDPADRAGGAVLVPLLLSHGLHATRDIPATAAAARAAHPRLTTRLAAPLGPHPLLAEALHARLTEAGWPAAPPAPGSHGVVLAAAGSRDPAYAAGVRRAAALLGRRLGVPVVPGYAAPTPATPATVPAAVAALEAAGVRRVAVASYFTAPGRFATEAAGAAPWLAASPLGAHPALVRLLLHRYDQACSAVPAPALRRPPTAA
ncbi:sirohydrochlorin chelatase [Streptomyces longispororuber]|uniref:sirohydrochlorin chelatase n=1 Tax=Streptomyces longispororuber TaxID=68230 RepID=UPI0033D2EE08